MAEDRITLDQLTANNVSIVRQKYIVENGVEQKVGEPWRRAYVNSTAGRQQVQDEVPEPYRAAIFAVWGDTPTVPKPVDESPAEEDTGSA